MNKLSHEAIIRLYICSLKEIFKIIIMRQTDELSDFREFNDQNINNKDENG